MAGISSPGIGSGLDIGGLVDQLVAAEAQPVANRLNTKETRLQAKLSAFGTLKSAVSQLQGALKTLSEVGNGRTAASSNTEVISASASSTAVVGNYAVDVSQLAAAHSLASQAYTDPTDVVGTGTLTIEFGTTDYDPTGDTYNGFTANPDKSAGVITIDSTNNTLEGVRDAINEADIGVNAVIVNDGSGYRLLLSSQDTGAANSLRLTVTDDGGSGLADLAFNETATNLEQTVAAQDAQLVINGLAVTSSSNAVDEAIQGVTLDLKDTTDGDPIGVNIALDKAAVRETLDGFITEYNALVDQIGALTAFNPETQEAAVLLGDSGVRNITSRLRNGLIDTVDGASEVYRNLIDLGVSTDDNGKLSVDDDTFDTALGDDFEGVVTLLNGIAEDLEGSVTGYLETGGVLDARTQGIQARIDDIGDQRLALDRRAEALQERYLKQFSALDTLLAQMQTTSNFLAQQLQSLPTPSQLNSNNNDN